MNIIKKNGYTLDPLIEESDLDQTMNTNQKPNLQTIKMLEKFLGKFGGLVMKKG